jgi:hypothetical protein
VYEANTIEIFIRGNAPYNRADIHPIKPLFVRNIRKFLRVLGNEVVLGTLIAILGVFTAVSEYYQSSFSQALLDSMDRDPDTVWDDQYHNDIYAEADAYFADSDAYFEKAGE